MTKQPPKHPHHDFYQAEPDQHLNGVHRPVPESNGAENGSYAGAVKMRRSKHATDTYKAGLEEQIEQATDMLRESMIKIKGLEVEAQSGHGEGRGRARERLDAAREDHPEACLALLNLLKYKHATGFTADQHFHSIYNEL